MIQEALNISYILVCIYFPSWFSATYLLLGVYLWLCCTFFLSATRSIYRFITCWSFVVLLAKALLLFIHHMDYLEESFELYRQEVDSFLGINLDFPLETRAIGLVPDACALVVSILCQVLIYKGCFLWSNETVLRYSSLASLYLGSCIAYSIPSSFYNIMCIYWMIVVSFYKMLPRYSLISTSSSILSLVQILIPLIPYQLSPIAGYSSQYALPYLSVILINISLSALNREELLQDRMGYKQPLIEKPLDVGAGLKAYILLQYFLGKVCLFLWITFDPGVTSLLIVLWFGFTFLEPSISITMRVNKYLLMPLLVFSYSYSYAISVWTQTPLLLHYSMLITIIIFSYIHRVSPYLKDINYTLPATWYGKLASILISHSYLFSLAVLFIIGLSAINLLHTGLMILCLKFMSNVKNVERHWWMLMTYVVFLIFLRETWRLFHFLLPGIEIDEKLLKVIGVSLGQDSILMIPYDYLLWLLLLCCSLQQFANNYYIGELLSSYNSLFFKVLGIGYSYFSLIEFWLIYLVLFFTIYLSEVNVLNLIRLFLSLWIISKHLSSPIRTPGYNFCKLNNELRILKIYSQFLLGSRYIFQFFPYFFGISTSIPMLRLAGYYIYGSKVNLYYMTLSDTILLVASVLAHRSNMYWVQRHDNLGRRITVAEGEVPTQKYSIIHTIFYEVFSRPYQYVLLIAIAVMCIFWKLSLSMMVYLIICGLYQVRVAYSFTKGSTDKSVEIKLLKQKEWEIRASNWQILFYFTVLCLIFSYMTFFITEGTVGRNYLIIEQAVNFTGFSRTGMLVLPEAFGYLMIFVFLIIERHCLKFNIPKALKRQKNGWSSDGKSKKIMDPQDNITDQGRNFESDPSKALSELLTQRITYRLKKDEDYENISSKINFISTLNLIKLLVETLIPMILLLLAFCKLTIISIIYVLSVFIISFFGKKNRTAILNNILAICILIQYGLVLYAGNSDFFSQIFDRPAKTLGISLNYFKTIVDPELTLIFLGTTIHLRQSIIYDVLTQIFILIYYFYLSTREKQLEILNMKFEYVKETLRIDEETNPYGFKAKLKVYLYKAKILFYKFARFSIVLIVLMFITQSKGVLSSLYCIFCVIFLFNENSIFITFQNPKQNGLSESLLNKQSSELKPIHSYINLLGYFLQLISFDLLLQMAFQLPYIQVTQDPECRDSSKFGCWCFSLGLLRLWSPDSTEIDPQELERRFQNILFKIFTFTILMMAQTMMSSKDFQDSHVKECQRIETESSVIALKMTHEFNRQRFVKNKMHSKTKKMFGAKIKKLEEYVKQWNTKFQQPSTFGEERFGKDLDGGELFTSAETGKGGMLANLLVNSINPCLFHEFISKITVISSALPDKKNVIKRQQDFKRLKRQFYNPQSFTSKEESPAKHTEKKNSEELMIKGQASIQKEYNITWKNVPLLICYVFASNTLSIVYLLFFLNHFKYASLVSLVFPLSVLGYAMLEYPRPRMKFFRIMLFYTGIIVCIKYTLQLDVWEMLFWEIKSYRDPFKIGLNRAENTYSGSIFYYVLWDVLLMFSLLCREYYMLRIGMWHQIETDIETLEEANARLSGKLAEPTHSELKEAGFFGRLMPKNNAEKPGKDLYLYSVILQLVILVYLFVFFNKLDGYNQDISQSIQSNQFQGRMVVALLIVVCLIIYDRYVYLKHTALSLQGYENESQAKPIARSLTAHQPEAKLQVASRSTYSPNSWEGIQGMTTRRFETDISKTEREREINRLLIVKLILHSFQLVAIHVIIFWYFPINTNHILKLQDNACDVTNKSGRCNDFQRNYSLQIFYVIYLIAVVIESQQIRYGLPSFTGISFPLMRHISAMSSSAFKVYKGLPFLFELRTVMDWTFTTTALNIFQWFKLEDIQAHLFLDQCSVQGLKYKKHGDKILMFEKCQYGACSLLAMLLIIMLPLFLFSSLNPIYQSNNILSAGLTVKLLIGDRAFKIYAVSTAESISNIDQDYFYERFTTSLELKSDDYMNMQVVNMPESAEVNWEITRPTRAVLESRLLSVTNSSTDFQLVAELIVNRKYPQSNPSVTVNYNYTLNTTHSALLYDMIFNNSTQSIKLPNMIYKLIELASAGDKIIPVFVDKEIYKRDVILTYIKEPTGNYWNISSYSVHDHEIGLRFYVISDNYSSVTFNFSIITFYISIVYLAGRLIRMITYGGALNIVMTEMQDTERLTTLCSAIYVCRMIGKLKKEEELYFELIDILRSPELTKALTGSSSIKLKKD